MEVATRLFARWGFTATTTAAIAEEAGITEPILYRHFETKHELFVAIVRDMSRKTLDHWRELIARSTNPSEQIRNIAREFPDHLKHLGYAYQVLHGALSTSRERKVVAVLREHYNEVERFFVGIITAGQKSGEFRGDVDPKVPAWILINLGIGYAMIALNLNRRNHFSIEQAVEFVLRGLKS
jgi:AcrR family transcriptional regulator